LTSDFEGRFYEFLQEHGYCSEAANYEHLRTYVPYFEPGERVLDLGCGRGDFLELLLAKGCRPEGVDIDPEMVAVCRAKGLTVHQGDAFAFLRTQTAAYDGIFASNFVEHFAPAQVATLFQLARQALKPGGKLLFAVPNPESLIVHLHEFWRDATHVRLYNRQLLEFLFSDSGFEIVAAGENEATRWQPALAEPALTPTPVVPSGPEQPPLPPLPALPSLPPIPPVARPTAPPQPLPALSLDETPLVLTSATATRLAFPVPSSAPVTSPPTDHSLPEQGVFSRLVSRLQDRLAHFLADRILSRQFMALQDQIANLHRQAEAWQDYTANLHRQVEAWQDYTANLHQRVEELQGAALRADQTASRIGQQVNTLVDAFNQLAPQTDQLWDALDSVVRAVNQWHDALQQALQTSTQQTDRNFTAVAQRLESMQAHLTRLGDGIGQVDQNTAAVQGALQSLRDNILFLYPAREVYVLGRRRED